MAKPNPGSDEAVDLGCTCPVMDNARGRGVPWKQLDGTYKSAFWMNGDCPLHGIDARSKAAEEEESAD